VGTQEIESRVMEAEAVACDGFGKYAQYKGRIVMNDAYRRPRSSRCKATIRAAISTTFGRSDTKLAIMGEYSR